MDTPRATIQYPILLPRYTPMSHPESANKKPTVAIRIPSSWAGGRLDSKFRTKGRTATEIISPMTPITPPPSAHRSDPLPFSPKTVAMEWPKTPQTRMTARVEILEDDSCLSIAA